MDGEKRGYGARRGCMRGLERLDATCRPRSSSRSLQSPVATPRLSDTSRKSVRSSTTRIEIEVSAHGRADRATGFGVSPSSMRQRPSQPRQPTPSRAWRQKTPRVVRSFIACVPTLLTTSVQFSTRRTHRTLNRAHCLHEHPQSEQAVHRLLVRRNDGDSRSRCVGQVTCHSTPVLTVSPARSTTDTARRAPSTALFNAPSPKTHVVRPSTSAC